MFSVFAGRQILARPSALLSLLGEILPRREGAHRDERVGNDRPSAVLALPSSMFAACSTLSSSFHVYLSLLEKFSADVGMVQEFLVGQINILIPRLHPILICGKREVSE